MIRDHDELIQFWLSSIDRANCFQYVYLIVNIKIIYYFSSSVAYSRPWPSYYHHELNCMRYFEEFEFEFESNLRLKKNFSNLFPKPFIEPCFYTVVLMMHMNVVTLRYSVIYSGTTSLSSYHSSTWIDLENLLAFSMRFFLVINVIFKSQNTYIHHSNNIILI